MLKKPLLITGVVTLFFALAPAFLTGEGVSEAVVVEPALDSGGKTVIDCAGREVEIPENPDSVGCLYAFSVHVAAMLGKDHLITSVVNGSKRDYLLNEISAAIDEAATPSDSGIINIEELTATEPDVVFLKGETARLEEETAKLDLFSIPYIVIDFVDIESQMRAIEIIGETLGAPEKALAYNKFYRDTLDFVKSRTSRLTEDEKIRLYHSVNEATRTDAAGTIMAEWTDIAGTINVSVGEPLRLYENKYFAGIEQILAWDPDVILANEYGVDKYILSNEKWATLKAVKEKRVWKIPTGISRWGHPGGMEIPMAALWTAKKLYPRLFEDVDMKEATRTFYRDFFDYEIPETLLDSMLAGGRMRRPKDGS